MTPAHPGDAQLQVVASTPILADLTAQVAGDRAKVTSLVPPGADPHTYEPSLRDVRDIAYADLALTNGLLLEQNKLLKTVQANLPSGASSVAVAENIESYGGKLEPVVEDASLDSIWLGLRVESDGSSDAQVRFKTDEITGPGHLAGFITETFGAVEKVADSKASDASIHHDGAMSVSQGDLGSLELPANAHTHLSWSFSAPGAYTLGMSAESSDTSMHNATEQKIHVVVGEDPQPLADQLGASVIDAGHVDITADMREGALKLRSDAGGQVSYLDPEKAVLAVPSRVLQEIPPGSQYRFLGNPGDKVYLLAQAVAGKHVHGDIDPHIWHSVPNAIAAVQVIRDSLMAADPEGAAGYKQRASELTQELEATDQEVKEIYHSLPPNGKNLITTHDGYRYLATEYGLNVAGYVTSSPGSEPSLFQRERLRRTIEDTGTPALYLERGYYNRTPVLQQIADESNVNICRLYSDTLDDDAPHYADAMLANARTIESCSHR